MSSISYPSLKYRKQVKKTPKMTCIIGGRCKEGVILAGDWKITNDDGSFEFKKKIYIDYYPVVIASSVIPHRSAILEGKQERLPKYFFHSLSRNNMYPAHLPPILTQEISLQFRSILISLD